MVLSVDLHGVVDRLVARGLDLQQVAAHRDRMGANRSGWQLAERNRSQAPSHPGVAEDPDPRSGGFGHQGGVRRRL